MNRSTAAAILRLSQDRYIDIIPSRGFCLRKPSEEDIKETCRVRTAIEGYCVMQLCREHDSERGKETIAQMRQLIEELRVLSEQGRQDPENEDIIAEILDNNVRFHLQIINYSESRIFLTLFHAHSNSILKYTSQNYSFSPRMSSICEEHGLILDAIESGDEMAGFTAVREHMESARDRSLQAYQNQAEAS